MFVVSVVWTVVEPSACSVVVCDVSVLVLLPVSVVVVDWVRVVVVDLGFFVPPQAPTRIAATNRAIFTIGVMSEPTMQSRAHARLTRRSELATWWAPPAQGRWAACAHDLI